MKIGVLSLQGAFLEHEKMLQRLGIDTVEVRQRKDLDAIDGIVLPGGESTVQGQLLRELDMLEPLRQKIQAGLPVLATCAGLILLAEHIADDPTTHLATLPITVKRNAYGRQLSSFSTAADVGRLKDFPLVFIRAPYIADVNKGAEDETSTDAVQVLVRVDGKIVGVRTANQIGLAFHPELTDDTRLHEAFVAMVKNTK